MSAAYSFESRWSVPASPEGCWHQLERLFGPGESWWPGVGIPEPPARIAPGEHFSFHVRSPLRYVLRMRLVLTEVQRGRRIAALSTGDLDGSGSIEVSPAGDGSSLIVIRWQVATRRRWMNVTAILLRPLFVAAHGRVMRAGERAIVAGVASEPRNTVNPGGSRGEASIAD